jgi:hypothetical protein
MTKTLHHDRDLATMIRVGSPLNKIRIALILRMIMIGSSFTMVRIGHPPDLIRAG